MGIVIKSSREIAIMRRAGKIAAEVLEILVAGLKPGMKTKELDDIAEKELAKRGAKPSFKGYNGFPASICVSINDEIVHGIPGNRVIREGDIVSIDLGTIYGGFQGDCAVTVGAGQISPLAARLIESAQGALEAGIKAARPGGRLGDISASIEGYARKAGYEVVREYTGHGIGREMHESPQVPNYGKAGSGAPLKAGMTLALEPMLNSGTWRTKVDEDMWTVRTADGGFSAHFEHTIAITEDGPEVLTAR